MTYLVFSQRDPPDEAGIVAQARSYFATDLRFVRRHYTPGRSDFRASFDVELEQRGRPPVVLVARVRAATEDDWRRADAAEIAGRAGGMGRLARRCVTVWEVDEADPRATLEFVAILAYALLGPVLPPDGSTLYGVRGARERAEKA